MTVEIERLNDEINFTGDRLWCDQVEEEAEESGCHADNDGDDVIDDEEQGEEE